MATLHRFFKKAAPAPAAPAPAPAPAPALAPAPAPASALSAAQHDSPGRAQPAQQSPKGRQRQQEEEDCEEQEQEREGLAGAKRARVLPPAPAEGALMLLGEPGWRQRLAGEMRKPYFAELSRFLDQEYARGPVFPPRHEVYSAFELCPFDKCKVVIIGQDPYHAAGQAHGLAFSVRAGVMVPPSLRNIYKETQACGFRVQDAKFGGSLVPWASQGVLMLNTVLTVRSGQANSHHKKGWETFTDEVIRTLSREKEGLVFLLWGKPAQTKAAVVDRTKHRVLTSSHPSPLAASKTDEPFIGSQCFTKANALLKSELGKQPIDWSC
jgi:uracil-DNA glycosylase